MNIHRYTIKVMFFVLSCTLCYSCSSDEEYIPFYASTLGDCIWLSLERQNGMVYDYDSLLQNNKLSVYGILAKRNTPLQVVTTDTGSRYIEFSADLPNSSSMQLNENRTEGWGDSFAIITIGEKRSKMTFHFKYESLNIPDMFGGNGIGIDSISYNNRKIKPIVLSNIRRITLRETSSGEFELQ